MTNKESLVSIIIPTYNSERFVSDSIFSVLNQTYENIEVIIVDDGSTDNTVSLIQNIADSRIKLFSQINQGACVARNRGISESTGEFIKFLDSDDILYPNAIEEQLKKILTLPNDTVVFGDFNFIDINNTSFYTNKINSTQFPTVNQHLWFMKNWEMLITCPLHRKEHLLKINGFNIKLKNGQESFLHIQLSLNGVMFEYQPQIIFGYRSHNSNTRISCMRMNSIPPIHDILYRNEQILNIIFHTQIDSTHILSTHISQQYFDSALLYFTNKQNSEGRFCLKKAMSTPRNKYPKFKKSSVLGFLFIHIGQIIGHRTILRVIEYISKTVHPPTNNHKENKLMFILPKENEQ